MIDLVAIKTFKFTVGKAKDRFEQLSRINIMKKYYKK